MEPSLAWGIAWGDSWGWSWGPLHEVEEHPGQVYGNGRKARLAPPDPLIQREDDAEIERIVREKWEAIEAAQARDLAATRKVAIATPDVAPQKPKTASETKQAAAPVTLAQVATNSIANEAIQAETAAREQAARNARAIAAILLMAEL